MFVVCLKTLKSKLVLVISVLLVIALAVFCVYKQSGKNHAMAGDQKYCLKAKGNEGRIGFLKQFGWEIEENPLEVCEIVVPVDFNDTYTRYNDLQKKQGLDLEKHKGKPCSRFTYKVTNHKASKDGVRANLLVMNEKVIAGDVCSVELKGFMHGFLKSLENGVEVKKLEKKPAVENTMPAPVPNANSGVGAVQDNAKYQDKTEADKRARFNTPQQNQNGTAANKLNSAQTGGIATNPVVTPQKVERNANVDTTNKVANNIATSKQQAANLSQAQNTVIR